MGLISGESGIFTDFLSLLVFVLQVVFINPLSSRAVACEGFQRANALGFASLSLVNPEGAASI